MTNSTNPLLIFCLKITALLAFVFHTNQGFSARVEYLVVDKNYSTLVVFSILWLLSIFVLLSVSFQQKHIVRVFWALIIAFTTSVSYGFYAAGGSELEVLDILELWQARHETGRAFEHFQPALIKAIIVALVGFVILAYPPPKLFGNKRNFLSSFSLLPIIPIFLFTCLIFIKSDRAVESLPQQFSPASMAAAISYKLAVREIPNRDSVKNVPKNPAKTKHLLYLVDESINPNYLYSKNGNIIESFHKHQDKIANFGISVSGSNCSARSNAILRLGATRNNLIESVRTSPSIWQYAKKAGFRTVYIDSQASDVVATKPNDFQNYMSSTEAKFIDVFYKVKNVPAPQLDYELLELVKKELDSSVPTFIYANKNGAHFPYNDNYPETEAIYQPVISKSKKTGDGALFDFYNKQEGIKAVVNSYKNSIRWTVDLFFKQFFNEINLNEVVVIYTADHGQYFNVGSTTHCTSGYGAPVLEGLVPMMLMTSNNELFTTFTKAAKNNYNKTDHFAIFPTVLDLLGYSNEVQNNYGPSLFKPNNSQNTAFNTGDILGVISKDTIWREVSMEDRLNNSPDIPVQHLYSETRVKE